MIHEWRFGRLIRERFWGVIVQAIPVGFRNDWSLTVRAGTVASIRVEVRL